MKRYTYSGPSTGLTLRNKRGGLDEIVLFAGRVYDLPEDLNAVKTLVALGRLTPVAAPAVATSGDRVADAGKASAAKTVTKAAKGAGTDTMGAQ